MTSDSHSGNSKPAAANGASGAGSVGAVFRVENILVKNISLEIPERVAVPAFRGEPVVQFKMQNRTRPLSDAQRHEVSLDATATVSDGDAPQLLVEVSQAGIFRVEGASAAQLEFLLNVSAPEALYPYAAQLISDLASRAGAPRFFPPPFNFRELHRRKLEAIEKRARESQAQPKEHAK